MCYGKTTYINNHIKDIYLNTNKSILYLTPRVSLSKECYDNLQKYDFGYYKDIKQTAGMTRNMVCQIDSIIYLNQSYDVVILDEFETLIQHIVSFDQMRNKHIVINDLFCLLKEASKIIVMDANLSEESINLLKNIDKDIDFKNYKFKVFKDKKCSYRYSNSINKVQREHFDFCCKLINEDKKIIIPCSSKKYSKMFKSNLSPDILIKKEEESSDSESDDIDVLLERKFPNKRILVINSDDILKGDINTLKEYDIVIYTAVLQCGCNFDLKHFDYIVPFITNSHSGAKMISQQLLRCRKFEEIHIFSYINRGLFDTVSKDDLIDRLRIVNLNDNILNFNRFNGELELDFKTQLQFDKLLEIENSHVNFEMELKKILRNHGFILTNINLDKDEIKKDKLHPINEQDEVMNIINASDGLHFFSNYEKLKNRINVLFKINITNEYKKDPEKIKAFIIHIKDKLDSYELYNKIINNDIDDIMNEQYLNISDCKKELVVKRFHIRKAIDMIHQYKFIINGKLDNEWFKLDVEDFLKFYNEDIDDVLNNIEVKDTKIFTRLGLEKMTNGSIQNSIKKMKKLLNIVGLDLESKVERENRIRITQYKVISLI